VCNRSGPCDGRFRKLVSGRVRPRGSLLRIACLSWEGRPPSAVGPSPGGSRGPRARRVNNRAGARGIERVHPFSSGQPMFSAVQCSARGFRQKTRARSAREAVLGSGVWCARGVVRVLCARTCVLARCVYARACALAKGVPRACVTRYGNRHALPRWWLTVVVTLVGWACRLRPAPAGLSQPGPSAPRSLTTEYATRAPLGTLGSSRSH
jgi:hypothetical protein